MGIGSKPGKSPSKRTVSKRHVVERHGTVSTFCNGLAGVANDTATPPGTALGATMGTSSFSWAAHAAAKIGSSAERRNNGFIV